MFHLESVSRFEACLLLVLEAGGEEFDQQTITNQAGETIHTRKIIALDNKEGLSMDFFRHLLVSAQRSGLIPVALVLS